MEISKAEQEGLVEGLNLNEDEIFEASFNLLGFFEVLERIRRRLEDEKLKNNEQTVKK